MGEIERLTYTVAELAKATGLSQSSVRRGIRDGSIPAIQTRAHGRVLILKSAFLEQVAAALNEEDPEIVKIRQEDTDRLFAGEAVVEIDGKPTRVPSYSPLHPENAKRAAARAAEDAKAAADTGYSTPTRRY